LREKKKFNQKKFEKMERRWINSVDLTEHHVYSQRLFWWLKNFEWNKIILPKNLHTAYHFFFNHTRPEIVSKYLEIIFSRHLVFLILEELNERIWRKNFWISEEVWGIKIILKGKYKKKADEAEKKAEEKIAKSKTHR
jgi:ribosomal protein L15